MFTKTLVLALVLSGAALAFIGTVSAAPGAVAVGVGRIARSLM
jgi:hypothetical protein